MNRKSLARELGNRKNLSTDKAESILSELFRIIEENLYKGEKVLVRDFGRFEARKTPATRRRNPRNGEMIDVPEKLAVSFSASQQLKNRVNNHGG